MSFPPDNLYLNRISRLRVGAEKSHQGRKKHHRFARCPARHIKPAVICAGLFTSGRPPPPRHLATAPSPARWIPRPRGPPDETAGTSLFQSPRSESSTTHPVAAHEPQSRRSPSSCNVSSFRRAPYAPPALRTRSRAISPCPLPAPGSRAHPPATLQSHTSHCRPTAAPDSIPASLPSTETPPAIPLPTASDSPATATTTSPADRPKP